MISLRRGGSYGRTCSPLHEILNAQPLFTVGSVLRLGLNVELVPNAAWDGFRYHHRSNGRRYSGSPS